jgi:hypothetical protein
LIAVLSGRQMIHLAGNRAFLIAVLSGRQMIHLAGNHSYF